MTDHTRREFAKLAGAATAAAATGVLTLGSTATGQSNESGWQTAESPTSKTLNDAIDTVEGPFAVGAGGDVVARRRGGWQTVVEYGPQARSRPLTGVDVTDDGTAIWFVGGSGVIGEYNVVTRTLTNYSAPNGKTSTWEDCAVTGTAGESERLYFVNGSGELLVGVRQESGAVQYADVIKPGGGSTIPGIDFRDYEAGHACSTSQLVTETTDGGESWNRIGIDFAGGAFFDVASVGSQDVNVAGGDGIVYRYDGFRWTPHVVDGERQAVRAIDRDGQEGLAAGAGGKVYERRSAGQWRRFETGIEVKLRGAARGGAYDVAVGDGGAIVERAVDRSDGEGGGTTSTNTTDGTLSTNETNETAASSAFASSDGPALLSEEPLSVETHVEGQWVSAFGD